jgi:hypothetical protein
MFFLLQLDLEDLSFIHEAPQNFCLADDKRACFLTATTVLGWCKSHC